MAENKVGRPTVMTDAVIGKLEELFARGLSDREACLVADVNPSTLYAYCNSHPDFAERKELLKEQPKLQAKLNVEREIQEGNVDISKWYLERKAKDEFSTKQEIDTDVKGAVTINIGLIDD